jgi:hypothetical protein
MRSAQHRQRHTWTTRPQLLVATLCCRRQPSVALDGRIACAWWLHRAAFDDRMIALSRSAKGTQKSTAPATLYATVIIFNRSNFSHLIDFLEHRMGFEPMNTGFADQRVSHFATGASAVPRSSRDTECYAKFTPAAQPFADTASPSCSQGKSYPRLRWRPHP